jgi:hypothetical protein
VIQKSSGVAKGVVGLIFSKEGQTFFFRDRDVTCSLYKLYVQHRHTGPVYGTGCHLGSWHLYPVSGQDQPCIRLLLLLQLVVYCIQLYFDVHLQLSYGS